MVMPSQIDAASLLIVDSLSEGHIEQLHALYQDEWWTKGRSLDATARCVRGSQICVGLETAEGRLVGFARVLTDFTFKALIFDVIVAEGWRGFGLGDRLMQRVMEHPQLRRVSHFELYCLREMSSFYGRHGFSEDVGAIRLMRRAKS